MNYELAKELKDAGFPQEQTQWVYVEVDRKWPPSLILRQAGYGGAIPTAAPSLEELIEACGSKFTKLALIGEGSWYADATIAHNPLSDARGSTPTEAVVRLWLALQKKV